MDLEHAQRIVDFQEAATSRGKVFHTKAHKRMNNEKYYTPPWAVRCLLRRVDFFGSIWEPAAGCGNIATALQAPGRTVWTSDLEPDVPGIEQQDFFAMDVSPAADIVTNPPFGVGGALALKFVKHALKLAEYHGGKVAMLLRDDFDSAKGRRSVFRDCDAFDRKIVITDRIRWTNLPQKSDAGPSGAHAWFVWDWSRDATQWPIVQYEQADVDLDIKKGEWLT